MPAPDISGINDNFFTFAQKGFATTLANTINDSTTEIPFNNLTGFSNGQSVALWLEPNTDNEELVYGIVQDNNITSAKRGVLGGASPHNTGSTVVMYVSSADHNLMREGILKEHKQSGAHSDITADSAEVEDLTVEDLAVTNSANFSAAPLTTPDYADGSVTADKLGLGMQSQTNNTTGTTTSTSFTGTLSGGGSTPAVTVTIGASGSALVAISSYMANSGTNTNRVSYAVSGATTIASATDSAITAQGAGNSQLGRTVLLTGLTPGSNTFTMQYNVSAGTGTFTNRNLTVIPL